MREITESKTKAQSIADSISRAILHGEYDLGQKLPSERDLAESFSVSRDTVRQAYYILEQTGLLRRVRGSGTHISTELRGHTDPISAVALVCPDFNDSFGVKYIIALEEALAQRNTLMVLKINKNPREDDKVLLDLMHKGINNFIIWASGLTELNSMCYRLRALGANLVFFDRVMPEGYADYVGLDNADAINKLLAHARLRGAEAFTFISLAEIVGDSTEMRRKAFVQWCEAEGFEYDMFLSYNRMEDKHCIRDMMDRHIGEDRRRAYVCVNDLTAQQVVSIYPDLEYVYSIDGLLAGNNYGIITVAQPVAELTAKAVELIFEQQQLGDAWKARKVILKGELIE